MAEVVGLVASGISIVQLTTQVAVNIIELKRLWNLVREAPSDIKNHVVQVDSIKLIISHIRDDYEQQMKSGLGHENLYMQRSLELCKEGTDELGAVVSDLSNAIYGKTGWRLKMGSMKMVLKKDDLLRLRQKLKSTIDLVSLAYQCHTTAMIQAQPDIIVARLSALATSRQTVDENSNGDKTHTQIVGSSNAEDFPSYTNNLAVRHYRYWASSSSWLMFLFGSFEYKRKCGTPRRVIDAKFRFPSWISNRIWECRGRESQSGWRLYLQTYRVLGFEHPLFRYARSGDVAGIQGLLSRREISVFDKQLFTGSTALHIAASRGHREVCKILITEGADVLSVDFNEGTPLHKTVETAAFVTFTGRGQAWEVSRLLINAGAGHTLIEDVDLLTRFEGPKAMFRYLLQQVYPPYYARPTCERFMIIDHLSSLDWHNTPDLMRLAMCASPLSQEMIIYADPQGRTLLHHIARSIANNMVVIDRSDCETVLDDGFDSRITTRRLDPNDYNHAGRQLAREIMSAGADLHAISHKKLSPLCELTRDFTDAYCSKGLFFESLRNLLRNWLHDLSMAGVDLLNYGEREKDLYLRGLVDNTFPFNRYSGRRGEFQMIFTHGSHPNSWAFWFSEQTDLFAGEFWAMIGRSTDLERLDDRIPCEKSRNGQEFLIPGSWVESARD